MSKIIDNSALVTMKISKGYYDRVMIIISDLLTEKCSTDGVLDNEKVNITYNKIKQKQVLDPWELTLETLLIFVNTFSNEAFKAGFTKDITEEDINQ